MSSRAPPHLLFSLTSKTASLDDLIWPNCMDILQRQKKKKKTMMMSVIVFFMAMVVSLQWQTTPIVYFPTTNRPKSSSRAAAAAAAASLRSSFIEPDHETDYSTEETLLCLRLCLQPDISIEDAKKRVSKYSQSFPFSAVLPVQPLTYLSTPDGGVEIRFLRKKTELKSGVDGGIRFFITETASSSSSSSSSSLSSPAEANERELEITAKRNSVGQTVPKIFAERLVVTAYISGITGEEDTEKRFGISPPTDDVVQAKSIFHKWMT